MKQVEQNWLSFIQNNIKNYPRDWQQRSIEDLVAGMREEFEWAGEWDSSLTTERAVEIARQALEASHV